MYVTGEDEGDETVEDEHSPGGIVVESLLNIRTIASLTMEEAKFLEYGEALRQQDAHPLRNNCIKGSGSGAGQFFQFWGLGLMFWFGSWLLNRFPEDYDFRDFVISLFALFFSLYGLTVAFENATDRKQAKLAAERIFSLTDRPSAIDPLDEAGDRPEEIFSVPGTEERHHHHHSKKHPKKHHHEKKSSTKKLLDADHDDGEEHKHSHKKKKKPSSQKDVTKEEKEMEAAGDVEEKKPSSGKKKKKRHHKPKDETEPEVIDAEVEMVQS